MRLLFVNSAWAGSWGGGEKWTVEAAHWFRAHGHDTLVVGRPGSRLLKTAGERGLAVVATPFGGDLAPGALLRAARIVKNFDPSLVVVNFNKEAWLFGLTAKMRGVPVVARHGFPLLHKGLHHGWLLTRVLDRVIVNAASIREGYRALGFPVEEIDVIHNGTAMLPQKRGALRKRFGIREDELLVLGAGRLESQKRFDRFLEVAAALSASRPYLKFLIAGDGPLHEELKARSRERQLDSVLQLAGFVPDFAEVAGDADLFLLTSEQEGTPNVLLEAMATGTACVSFGVGAVPQILGGALTENVIAPGSIAAMSARAATLLDDRPLREQVAKQMQARIAGEFSVDASMERFEKLFQQIFREKR